MRYQSNIVLATFISKKLPDTDIDRFLFVLKYNKVSCCLTLFEEYH